MFELTKSQLADSVSAMLPAPATSKPTERPTAIPERVWRARVKLNGKNNLSMNEVQVFDSTGVNVAKNKPATQSSTTFQLWHASNAVNDVYKDLDDFSMTNYEQGLYHTHEQLADANHFILTI